MVTINNVPGLRYKKMHILMGIGFPIYIWIRKKLCWNDSVISLATIVGARLVLSNLFARIDIINHLSHRIISWYIVLRLRDFFFLSFFRKSPRGIFILIDWLLFDKRTVANISFISKTITDKLCSLIKILDN